MRARLVVATLALALCVPSPAQAQSAKELVQALARRALAGGLDVGTAAWSGSALDLADVTLLDAERQVVARLGRVHVVLRPMALYAAGAIDDVEIEGVALKLRRMPDGRLGIGRLLGAGGGGNDFAIERAQVRGPLVVSIPGRAPTTLTLDVAARLTRTGAATHVRLDRLIVEIRPRRRGRHGRDSRSMTPPRRRSSTGRRRACRSWWRSSSASAAHRRTRRRGIGR